jgi:ssDNA-binding Zn-finger/Zn-ribbon topoisomerase 1
MWYKDASEFMAEMGHNREDRWFPRVTKILDVKSKPALDAFFKEMGSYESAEEVKNKSAKEGSLVHEVVQKVAIAEPVDIPDSIAPAVAAFTEFSARRGIQLHPDFIERAVTSEKNRYTGTVDALAEIDGKFGVLDIKTSTGFFREYNLQTAAYVLALQEYETMKALRVPRNIETRWILRINQHKVCIACKATLREKGGRNKVRTNGKKKVCAEDAHEWGALEGDVELREFPYYYGDIKAFLAAKTLWEWEHSYWLRQVGYL